MSTTLTGLIPDLYESLDIVSRELVGFIPSVTLDTSVDRAAIGQTVRNPITPAAAATNITPGVTPPDDGNQTIANVPIALSKARRVPIRWTGEQERGANTGVGAQNIRVMQISQAMRTLCNEIEADLAALHITTSRAVGTAGTTPFASTLTDPAQARRVLSDNGAPLSDMSLVIDTVAGASMRTLAQLNRVNEAGDSTFFRQGQLLNIHGFAIRESAAVPVFTRGTGTSYTTSAAGFAVGATSIPIITGSGTVLAGDVVTFAGDTNQYVVTTGVAAPGTIVIAAPGLRRAIPASATAMTIVANSTRNMAFSRNALVLAQRLPALPEGGDLALDRTTITDPRSGLSFEVAMYPQYRQMQWEISCVWGVANVKPEHSLLLLG